jgi:hypothetical protein
MLIREDNSCNAQQIYVCVVLCSRGVPCMPIKVSAIPNPLTFYYNAIFYP